MYLRLRILVPLLALLLAACLPLPPDPAILVPSSTLPSPTATFTPPAAPSPWPTTASTVSFPLPPSVTRVVIISIDGLRPEAIARAPMPVLEELMRTGAYSLTAQTITPSSTLPGHTSMLSGLCPSVHGVDWDHYLPEKGYALGTDLFDVAHAAGLRTVMVVAKEKLRQMVEPASLDVFLWVNDPDRVVARRAAELMSHGFSLLFVHLSDTDHAGHDYDWMSPPQLLSLRATDDALKVILNALDAAAMRQATLIIVTADHGGHDGTHSSGTPPDLTIPWIINGPGIVPAPFASNVSTTDTAATAAWALGLSLPPEWAGRPVLEAFGLPDDAARPLPRCP